MKKNDFNKLVTSIKQAGSIKRQLTKVRSTMTTEQTLFSWTDWDGDYSCMTFYNVTLKVPVGKWPAGSKFDSATLINDKGILQLCNTGPWRQNNGHKFADSIVMGEYQLKLSIDKVLTENEYVENDIVHTKGL